MDELSTVFSDKRPVAWVKKEGLLTKSFLSSIQLDYLRRLSSLGYPVFSRGMDNRFLDIHDPGDSPRRVRTAAGLRKYDSVISWRPAAEAIRYHSPLLHIHGYGIGEPGLYLPSTTKLVTKIHSRHGTDTIKMQSPKPGKRCIMFRKRVIPSDSIPIPLSSISSYAAGFVLGVLFRSGVFEADRFIIRTKHSETIDKLHQCALELPFVELIEENGIALSTSGPFSDIAAQMCRKEVPPSLYMCSDIVWQGISDGLLQGISRIQTDSTQYAAHLYRMLCRAGYGCRTSVNIDKTIWFRVVDVEDTDVIWRKVKIDYVDAPFGVTFPITTDLMIHMSGIVLSIPAI